VEANQISVGISERGKKSKTNRGSRQGEEGREGERERERERERNKCTRGQEK